jgi:hypothetical protein
MERVIITEYGQKSEKHHLLVSACVRANDRASLIFFNVFQVDHAKCETGAPSVHA